MTSPSKAAANRLNAGKSCGPRTTAGKARSAQNARRHGLSVCTPPDDLEATQIHCLAQLLAPADTTPAIAFAARRVAELRVQLIRIRRMQSQVASRCSGATLVEELRRTDRYLTRQSARFCRAVRELDALIAGAKVGNQATALDSEPADDLSRTLRQTKPE
jgi:hypothetical protein